MTVNSVSNSSAAYFAQTRADTNAAGPEAGQKPAHGDAVRVETSDTARQVSDLRANMPRLFLDPEVHMANAESQLQDAMAKLGIPPETDIDIKMMSDGRIGVTGDHEKIGDLKDAVNGGFARELRNSLIGAHTGKILERIAHVTEMAAEGAQNAGSKAEAEAIWQWALGHADSFKSSRLDLSYSDGGLTADLKQANGSDWAALSEYKLPV